MSISPQTGCGITELEIILLPRQFRAKYAWRKSADASARDACSGGSAVPEGPNGEKRPADAIGRAVMIAKIATGEMEDPVPGAKTLHARKAANARAASLSPERRAEIARKAAQALWRQRSSSETGQA